MASLRRNHLWPDGGNYTPPESSVLTLASLERGNEQGPFVSSQRQVEDALQRMRTGGGAAEKLAQGGTAAMTKQSDNYDPWQASLPEDTPHACVSVIGVSSAYLPQLDGGLARGVGKSCACGRFVHPSYDDYWVMQEDHESCISEAAFQEAEHCGTHTLYFGSVVKNVPMSGAAVSAKSQISDTPQQSCDKAVFHVVEHTTFVDQDSLLPLPSGEEGLYAPRATSPGLPCVRQNAYIGRRFSKLHLEKRERLPPIFNGQRAFVSGYLLVLDVSRCQEETKLQIDALEDMLLSISAQRYPHRVALVLTKCDAVSAERLADVREQVRQQLVTVAIFEMSAKRGVGVEAPFFYIYRSAESGRSLDPAEWSIPYAQSLQARTVICTRMEQSLLKVLAENVTSFYITFEAIVQLANEAALANGNELDGPLAAVLFLLGRDRCKALVQRHLLELKSAELCDRLQQEFMQAMSHHPDFGKDDTHSLPKFKAVSETQTHTPNVTAAQDSLAALNEEIRAIVEQEVKIYYESAMVDMLGLYWDRNVLDRRTSSKLFTPLLYNGSVQKAKMLLRMLTGNCMLQASGEVSLYGASPPASVPMPKALPFFSSPQYASSPPRAEEPKVKRKDSAIYEEVGEGSPFAKIVKPQLPERPPDLPPRSSAPVIERPRLLQASASCFDIRHVGRERQEVQRERLKSDHSTQKKRSKSPWRKVVSLSTSSKQSSTSHERLSTASPPSMFSTSPRAKRRIAKSNDSILASPPQTQGNSPVFVSPTEKFSYPQNVTSLNGFDGMKISHSRSNSSPVLPTPVGLTTMAGSFDTSPVDSHNIQDDGGYLAPSEINQLRLAISPANIHTETSGHSTLPRTKRASAGSTQMLISQTLPDATQRSLYHPRRSNSISGKQNGGDRPFAEDRFFPIHLPPAAGSGQCYEPTVRSPYQSPTSAVGMSPKPSPLMAQGVGCENLRSSGSEDDSSDSTDHASDGMESPVPIHLGLGHRKGRRGSLVQSAFQPVDMEEYQFRPISFTAPKSPPVFETDDVEAEDQLPPRPDSCMSQSTDV